MHIQINNVDAYETQCGGGGRLMSPPTLKQFGIITGIGPLSRQGSFSGGGRRGSFSPKTLPPPQSSFYFFDVQFFISLVPRLSPLHVYTLCGVIIAHAGVGGTSNSPPSLDRTLHVEEFSY